MKHRMITIVGWDEFQHYKERDPIWIKNYVRLLRQDEYMDLTPHRRALLHGLWLLYASKRRALRHDTATLSRELGMRVMSADLESLRDAGFVTFSASKSLARRKQPARPEVEKETEVETPNGVSLNGRARDLLWEALVEEVGSSPSTRSERGAWNSALKELREAEATPEGIHVKAQVYRRRWPEVSLTPTALAKHWGALAATKREELTPEQRAQKAMEETNRRAAAAAERIRNRESV